nr:MAG TPA: protein of unknown function (DUF5320) [Caudoviricetes sp.]
MTIYIDSDFKCHATTADGLTAVDTNYFDGKCPAYIEGYRFVPAGQTWTRPDGVVFQGEMVSPWKPWRELDAAQRAYEQEQLESLTAQNAEYEAALAEIEAALGVT